MSTAPSISTTQNASGRWLLSTFALIGLVVGLEILVAWRMDVFGVLRDTKGRSLVTSRRERKAKYLLNQAYVPTNFDALVIGSSASINWPMANLTGYRFYNESVEGGNATEERMIVDHALERGHFKIALVALYPKITHTHAFEDGLDRVNWAEALGSLDAFELEEEALISRLRHRQPGYYADGSHNLPWLTMQLSQADDPKLDVAQDGKAVADYRGLIGDLTTHGVKVIYVCYPMLEWNYQYNHDSMVEYMQSVARNMPPEPTIDFNSAEYTFFRADPSNYVDVIHLSPKGARTLTRLLDQRLHEILQSE